MIFQWLKRHKKGIVICEVVMLVFLVSLFVPMIAIVTRSLFLVIFCSVVGSILMVVAAIYLVKVLNE